MNLKKWQHDFYQAIFHPSQNNIQLACQGINETESLSASQRLHIYRDSILGGMTDGLSGIFPVCKNLLGAQYFSHMLTDYLKQNPSFSPDLGNYGELLPNYIAQFKPAKDLLYLPEVAKLEWLWHKAFNASGVHKHNTAVYTLDQLASITEHKQARIQFVLQPSIQLMQSDYPIHLIWEMNQDNYNSLKQIDLNGGGVNLLIFRSPDYSMNIHPLNKDEFIFYQALQSGLKFSDIAGLTFTVSLEVLLTAAIQSGLIIGFNLA